MQYFEWGKRIVQAGTFFCDIFIFAPCSRPALLLNRENATGCAYKTPLTASIRDRLTRGHVTHEEKQRTSGYIGVITGTVIE